MKKILALVLVILVGGVFTPTEFYVEAAEHQHESPEYVEPKKTIKREKSQLQKLIDNTEPGGTLQLEGRVYRGSLSISKPITIKGVEGTEIQSLATALTIEGTNNVVLENIVFQAEETAIFVSNVEGISLKNVLVQESFAGIRITNSENIQFQNVDIKGTEGHFSTKGHAIAIYESKNFFATNSDIEQVMDGFYLESVDEIQLTKNHIKNSRYAVHMMYSNQVQLHENNLENNMTGFMVMVAKDVQIKNNIVARNNSLNSLGVYTYDIEGLQFKENELYENTIAMDIQNVKEMVIEDNLFSTNGTVLQVKRSGTLLVNNNEFHSNILAVRTDSAGVNLNHNFYDDYSGKDYDGDKIGDTEYIATNSFGQWMVRKPVYQYFMESPSVVTLNMMDTEVSGNNKLIIVDENPIVMKKPLNLETNLNILQFMGAILVLIAIFIVRRRLR